VQQRPAERNQHERTRVAECVAEGIKSAIKKRRRDAPGKQRQIGARLHLDAGFDRRELQQDIRMLEKNNARQGQDQGQPEALLQRPGNLAIAPGALEMRDGR